MSNWNEADHPRDDEGKFTFKGGSSSFSSSIRETNEEKMQRRADTLYPTMQDKNEIKNLKETDIIEKYNNIQTEIFKQNLYNKSLENAVKWDSSCNAKFSDSELQRARIFIQGIEEFKPNAYKPTPNDVWTIGYGHTGFVDGKPITPGMKITKEKAEELYRKDFESHIYPLKNIQVPLTNNQKIALASFLFNVGPGVLNKNSDILKKLNDRDYKGAANEFDKYIYQTNKKTGKKEILNGLVNRRKREKVLFLTPDD